jgi:hypothetical protein
MREFSEELRGVRGSVVTLGLAFAPDSRTLAVGLEIDASDNGIGLVDVNR